MHFGFPVPFDTFKKCSFPMKYSIRKKSEKKGNVLPLRGILHHLVGGINDAKSQNSFPHKKMSLLSQTWEYSRVSKYL